MIRYWMVLREKGQENPTVKHFTQELAGEEAMRLARKYPGEVFTVLESVAGYEVELPDPTWLIPTEHPALDWIGKPVLYNAYDPFYEGDEKPCAPRTGTALEFDPKSQKVKILPVDGSEHVFAHWHEVIGVAS